MTATKKHIPGKRIKTWWRNWGKATEHKTLRAFARSLLKSRNIDEQKTAHSWADGKVA